MTGACVEEFDFPDSKGTAEKIPVTFDFSTDLATGETLTGTPTVTVTVAVRSVAKDSNPTEIQNGSAIFDSTSTMVILPTQAGVNGCRYRIAVLVPTTNPAKVLELVGNLLVSDAP